MNESKKNPELQVFRVRLKNQHENLPGMCSGPKIKAIKVGVK
ncbi:hypothetical protein M595_1039 [Lyngbya aestuarii BL J]|uniref:Uncharacterized protein n=1 Tax=Lyngbya aestuarii BL J TaxID=1348334 RepID=U7QP57_9CYAN|nr:hypothetical protein M595_1039 [Lyngbya aestuarii BL J]